MIGKLASCGLLMLLDVVAQAPLCRVLPFVLLPF